jgi:energy-coupling factor transporter ATP-binding protein EcfA2
MDNGRQRPALACALEMPGRIVVMDEGHDQLKSRMIS